MLAGLNKAFKKVDLFPNAQLLRYNGESDYTSLTGGILSVAVIVIFIVLFANMGFKTVNKDLITSSIYTEQEVEPSELKI